MKTTTSGDVGRMLNPVHPGPFLRSEIVEAYGLSVTEAANVLGVSRPTLSTFLNGRSSLSGDMALRFAKAFGLDMEMLMRIQHAYDIAQAKRREKLIKVARYRPAA